MIEGFIYGRCITAEEMLTLAGLAELH